MTTVTMTMTTTTMPSFSQSPRLLTLAFFFVLHCPLASCISLSLCPFYSYHHHHHQANHRHHHHASQAGPCGVGSRNGSSGGPPYMPSLSSPTEGVPPNYRTEMCRNITKYGFCSYRGNCHFAHSEEERVVKHVNAADDILMWPCPILLMTGYW